MTKSVGVHEAKTNLSKLLERVAGGEEVARLVPARPTAARRFGVDRGRWVVPDDFDAPLPNEVLASFE